MTSIKVAPVSAGSAPLQGDLWSARSDDWAAVQEAMFLPLYDAVLARIGRASGTRVLDVGCGSGLFGHIASIGLFGQLASAAGAQVSGIDAAPRMIAIARERTPSGDFRVGELEDLPYEDKAFDVVTGLNAFQLAAHPVVALREARRVTKRGGSVFVATWGPREHCEAAEYLAALDSLLPPKPDGAPGPFALSDADALMMLVADSGLAPCEVNDIECFWTYQNLETALRGLLSTGQAVAAIRHVGEAVVRECVAAAIHPFKTTRGEYRLENTFRYLEAHR